MIDPMNPPEILVVEDEILVAKNLQQRLQAFGYRVPRFVVSGEDALQVVDESPPDVVLMDVRLAGVMTGAQAAEKIRARHDIPVVFLTAYSDDATLQQVKAAEPFGYLLKPFREQELRITIDMALYKHSLEKKLRQSESKYRTLIEMLNTGIFMAALDGNFLQVNSAMVEMAGYESIGDLMQLPAEKLYAETSAWQELIAQLHRQGFVKNVEVKSVKKNGAVYWTSIHAVLIRDSQDEPVAILGSITDITERKQSEAALKDAQARLLQSEKLASIGQLVAGIAHELNNPLTSVVLYSQILQQMNTGEQIQNELEKVVSESMRAARIVRGLLDFARQRSVTLQPAQINSIIEKSLDLVANEVRANKIHVELNLAHDLLPAMVDELQMQQVVVNLLKNALDAIGAGRSDGCLRISTQAGLSSFQDQGQTEKQPVIRIAIEDNGPGIPNSLLARVFDPFFTTKPVGQGTGLGLAICHGIVAEHGGSIWGENRLEGGACFLVELRVADLPGAQDGVDTQPEKKAPPELKARRSILLIDDETALLDAMTCALQEQGYQVECESDGRLALDRLSRHHYDLILSDISMPGIGGSEIYRRVQEFYPEMAQRILFITGDTVSPPTHQFLEQTGVPYLIKPFGIHQLTDRVQQFFE